MFTVKRISENLGFVQMHDAFDTPTIHPCTRYQVHLESHSFGAKDKIMSKSNKTTKIFLVTSVAPSGFRMHSTDRETGRFTAGGRAWHYAGELCGGPRVGDRVTSPCSPAGEQIMKVKNEDQALYLVTPAQADDEAIIAQAIAILGRNLKQKEVFASPGAVKQYCQLHLGRLEHEVFGVLFVDAQNRLIEFREMFRGTLTQSSVYPREVVKEAIALNAAAVIFTHNHPSGSVQPSRADEALTQTLKQALGLIDVRVLDHVIVSAGDTFSFAENGRL